MYKKEKIKKYIVEIKENENYDMTCGKLHYLINKTWFFEVVRVNNYEG